MLYTISAIVTLLAAAVVYFVIDLIRKRSELDGLPQPPMQNRLLGHLAIAGEMQEKFPDDLHTHGFFDYVRRKYDLPEVFYLDWRPFAPKWLFIADPEMASLYVTTTQSLPKAPVEKGYLDKFLGNNNMVSMEGEHWKYLRSMFNPGFSAGNVMSFMDYIVDATVCFARIMQEKARLNEHFQLEEYATRMTIDIIGKITLDCDLNSQQQIHPIVQLFRSRVKMMPKASATFPWQDVDIWRPYNLWSNNRQLEAAINVELDRKINRRAQQVKENATNKKKQRSVVDLALETYENEFMAGDNAGKSNENNVRIGSAGELPASFRRDIVDQIKTFVFAGHDTSSSTICYVLYLLHLHPKVFSKLKHELDTYLASDISTAAENIKSDPHIINKLEYTNAIIRETLRIFPPASTIREPSPKYPSKERFAVNPRTGQRFPLEGCAVWPVVHLISRNERFFPEPTKFVPERHIQSQTPYPDSELFTPAGKDAWRPFEKGPRNCIGQELAMVELRVFVALMAREFDFVVEFPGEEADVRYFEEGEVPPTSFEERKGTGKKMVGDRLEGYRMYQTLAGAAKPVGGCPGRMKLRSS